MLLYCSRLFRFKAHPIALRGWVVYYKEFEIIKINRTKAECKCVVTGKLWNIQIASLKPTDKVTEVSEMQIDRTERQPNNRKQW